MSKKFLNLRAMNKHSDLLIPRLIGGAVGGLLYLVAGALGQSWGPCEHGVCCLG